eukprot:NODE_900_length_1567_cov_24.363889_g889_i0.p1 GENE.NODE_900_length_1567_cov_24.363889_g889_i0~~NODE_900_length_1567_cov_24.363889_g889_i0.p1  ORF type:complete len:493 (-),score=53.83 NODE_900_length_1567_cov_24.363889_g889_i0:88-1485(-)
MDGGDVPPKRLCTELIATVHPLGVKPLGNAAGASRMRGLGSFQCLTDDLIVDLLAWMPPVSLCRLSGASAALHAFANNEDHWRDLTVAAFGGNWRWTGTWKHTYASKVRPGIPRTAPVHIPFCSDHLYAQWMGATGEFASTDWLSRSNVPRCAGLSVVEFRDRFERPNIPVILTDVVRSWPAFKDWNPGFLLEQYGKHKFRAGPVDMELDDYWAYMQGVAEERPLYIFDSKFAQHTPALGEAYTVPEYFQNDLFAHLGEHRPDNRWIIIGPKRSGSSMHIDPNSTCAWNALIRGRKKWVMFPPGRIPPGVMASSDGAEVASPVSLIEWFLFYYKAALDSDNPPVECVAEAGELIFVPKGWWHLVLNLEPSVAITQNYASAVHSNDVLGFLDTKRDQVSGVPHGEGPKMYDRLRAALEEHEPEIVRQYDCAKAESAAQMDARRAVQRRKAALVATLQDKNASFSLL